MKSTSSSLTLPSSLPYFLHLLGRVYQLEVIAEVILSQYPQTPHVERRENPAAARLLLVRHLALLIIDRACHIESMATIIFQWSDLRRIAI